MSYAVHVWEYAAGQPWPTTLREVNEVLRALRSRKVGQNPKFIALAGKLTARYPCITSPKAEDLPDYELAWSDGPLDGKTDEAVYGVGIRAAMLDEVRPFVIEQARALELNVVDVQTGEAFLANGQVLGSAAMSPTASPAPIKEGCPRARDVRQMVFEQLVPVMQGHGFKPLRGTQRFLQKFEGGWHEIAVFIQYDGWPVCCEFDVAVTSRFDAVQDIYNSLVEPPRPPAETKRWRTAGVGLEKFVRDDCELFRTTSANGVYKIRWVWGSGPSIDS